MLVKVSNDDNPMMINNDGPIRRLIYATLGGDEVMEIQKLKMILPKKTPYPEGYKAAHHCLSKPNSPRLNIKIVFPRYGDSHVKDKTVARPSYL